MFDYFFYSYFDNSDIHVSHLFFSQRDQLMTLWFLFMILVMVVVLSVCELGSYTLSAVTLTAEKCPHNYSSMTRLTANAVSVICMSSLPFSIFPSSNPERLKHHEGDSNTIIIHCLVFRSVNFPSQDY